MAIFAMPTVNTAIVALATLKVELDSKNTHSIAKVMFHSYIKLEVLRIMNKERELLLRIKVENFNILDMRGDKYPLLRNMIQVVAQAVE